MPPGYRSPSWSDDRIPGLDTFLDPTARAMAKAAVLAYRRKCEAGQRAVDACAEGIDWDNELDVQWYYDKKAAAIEDYRRMEREAAAERDRAWIEASRVDREAGS